MMTLLLLALVAAGPASVVYLAVRHSYIVQLKRQVSEHSADVIYLRNAIQQREHEISRLRNKSSAHLFQAHILRGAE